MPTRLIKLIEKLNDCTALLVGDLMIDRYCYGNAERVSPEAPVPVLHFAREDARLGGAGRVAADLATLGAQVRVVSVIGKDAAGAQIKSMLQLDGVNLDGLVESSERTSTAKVRLVGLAQHRHAQQMIRLDYEDLSPLPATLARQLLDRYTAALEGVDVVCLEDYNKGTLAPAICQEMIRLAREKSIPVLVDPAAIADYSRYAGCTGITPNRTESRLATGLPCDCEADYAPLAERLLNSLNLDAAILTLDKDGAYLATRDGLRRLIGTRPRNVYDVAGAGDMVLAMVSASRAVGASWDDAVMLGNVAGGLEVEKFGSVPLTRQEIVDDLLKEAREHLGKQRTLERLLDELHRHRAAGRKVVFTNGCFDLIHLGHVQYFRYARSQGDLLVVGVNTDLSIRKLKGPKRPIINEQDRLGVLEELESIDYLVRFDQDTPMELIEAIRPDVLVKGADYRKDQVVGADLVESYGGRIALAPLVDGKSTSAVIQRILEAYGS